MSSKHQTRGSLVNSLLRGTGINFVGLVIRFVLIFLQTFLAVKLYGAEYFGVYILAVSIVNFLSYTGQLGFSRAVVRYVALYIERKQWSRIGRFLWMMLLLTVSWSAVIGVILIFASEHVEALFSEVKMAAVFGAVSLAIPCLTLATLLAAFTQAFGVMWYKVITLDILAPGLEIGLLVLLWRMGYSDDGLVFSYTISLLIVCVVLCLVTFRFLRLVQSRAAEHSLDEAIDEAITVREVLRFSFYAWLSLLLRHATRPVNIFVIGALGTAAMVGVYSVLERLVAVGVVFLMSVNAMLAPMVSSLVERQDYDQLGRIYTLAARWSLSICLPVFVFLAAFGDRILMLFGSEFVAGASALWLLSFAWIFSLLTGPADVILMMSGRSQYSALSQVIMIALMISIGWWLIPTLGLIGAVVGFSVATVVVNILRVVQVKMHLQIHPFGWPTAKVLIAGCVMLFSLLGVTSLLAAAKYSVDWIGVISIAIFGLISYLLVLFILRLEVEEIRTLNTVLKRLQPKNA